MKAKKTKNVCQHKPYTNYLNDVGDNLLTVSFLSNARRNRAEIYQSLVLHSKKHKLHEKDFVIKNLFFSLG